MSHDGNYGNVEGFSPYVSGIIEDIDGHSFIPLFNEQNIGIQDLVEFTDLDLIILGVDSAEFRNALVNETFPKNKYANSMAVEVLKPEKIVNMLADMRKQLKRILFSLLTIRQSLDANSQIQDVLLKCDHQFYSSDIILDCLNHIEVKLSKLKVDIRDLQKIPTAKIKTRRRRKLTIVAVGGTCIAILTIGLIKSLRNI